MAKPTFRWVKPSPFCFITLPNLVSYLSFLCSLAAAHFALRDDWSWTGAFIGGSALADMLDGKFARLFKGTTGHAKFGGELDSLIDVVAFGVVPVFAARLYFFPGGTLDQLLWIAAAVWYILAVITRLGYFNVYSMKAGNSFVGLPTTM